MTLICYLLIVAVQAVSLTTITGLVLPYKRKIHILYTYLIHLGIIVFIDIVRYFASDEVYAVAYIFFNIIEVLLPYIFARYFVKSLLWKSSFCYLVMGVINNLAFHIVLMQIPIGTATMAAYIDVKWQLFTLPGAIVYVLSALFSYFTLSLINRKIIRTDKQFMEKYFRLIYIIISVLISGSNVLTRTDRDYYAPGYTLFWTKIVPAINILAVIGLVLFFIFSEKKKNENQYKNLIASRLTERGNSNKEINLFLDDELNVYLNDRVGRLKESGTAVDVISYMSEKINSPLQNEVLIHILDEIFTGIDNSRNMKQPFTIICFKKQAGDMVIHFEYSKSAKFNTLKKIFTREYLYIYNDYYRLDEIGLMRDEVTLLFRYNKMPS